MHKIVLGTILLLGLTFSVESPTNLPLLYGYVDHRPVSLQRLGDAR